MISSTGITASSEKVIHKIHRTENDGMESAWLQITSGSFEGRRYWGGDWILQKKPSKGASISFHKRTVPSVLMDFSIFRTNGPISGLDKDALKEYIEQVEEVFSGVYNLRVEDLEKTKVSTQPFMGRGYRRISFECINPNTGEVEVGICDFLTIHESGTSFRLRFTAPIDYFERMSGDFADEINRFTIESI